MERSYTRSYTPNGELKVLYSPDYGAGWSTWNQEGIVMALDSRIIEYYEKYHDTASEKDVAVFLASIGYPDPCVLGWEELTLTTIPQGTRFRIREYDGAEYIEILKPLDWTLS